MADSHEHASTPAAALEQAPMDSLAYQHTDPRADTISTKPVLVTTTLKSDPVVASGAALSAVSTQSTTSSTVATTTKSAFMPFQSPRSTQSMYLPNPSVFSRESYHHSSGTGSGGGGGSGRSSSSSAAAASLAALQLQRELDLQHEAVSRRPQLVQDIAAPKEPSNSSAFRDYGPTARDWGRRDSSLEREQRDRSMERDRYSRERHRYTRSGSAYRRDHSRDQDRERDHYRDRYRDHSRDRGSGRDADYRGESSSRRYRDEHRYYEGYRDARGYRDYRHERYYRKERDGRDGPRDYEYDGLEPRNRRYEGDNDDDRGPRHPSYRRDSDRESDRDRYREWDRVSEHDYARGSQEQQRSTEQDYSKDTDLGIEKVALEDHDYQPLHRPSRDLTILEPKVEPWHLSKEKIAAQTAVAVAAVSVTTAATTSSTTISVSPLASTAMAPSTAMAEVATLSIPSLAEAAHTLGTTTAEHGKAPGAPLGVVTKPSFFVPEHSLQESTLVTGSAEQAQTPVGDVVMKSPVRESSNHSTAPTTAVTEVRVSSESTFYSDSVRAGHATSAQADDDLDHIPKGPRNQESRSSLHWDAPERDYNRKYVDDRDYYYHSRRHGYSSSHRHYDYYDKYDKYADRNGLRSSRGSPPPPSSLSQAIPSETSSAVSSPPPPSSSVYASSHQVPPPPRRSVADEEYFGYHRDHGRDHGRDRDRERERDHHYRAPWHSSSSCFMDHYRDVEGGRYESSARRGYSHWSESHKRPPSPSVAHRDRYDYDTYDSRHKGPVVDCSGPVVSGYHSSPPTRDLRPVIAATDIGIDGNVGSDNHATQARPISVTAAMQKVDDLYERVGQVGEGTYGKVYKARNKQTGEFVALKRIRMEAEKDGFPITAMREIKLLQTLNHRHVVSLRELMVSKGAVYMVLEYMDHDLTGILGHPHLRFKLEHIKCLLRQLLEGLAFLHHKGVLHRDMKGSNLLVNRHGELKLTDFGLARLFQKKAKRDYTNRVITLWYRPPELLLGATAYGPEVDMWSAGCIMVELFTRKPIFTGQNEISQLDNIWRVMGTPQVETWPELNELQWFDLLKPLKGETRPSKFREMYGKVMSPAAMDLAEALLCLNPKKRPSAAEALKFPYFTEEQPPACLPEELPKIEGDWHEYESKQRKKFNAKVKQQPGSQHTKKDADRSDVPNPTAFGAAADKMDKPAFCDPGSDATPQPLPENQMSIGTTVMPGTVSTVRVSSLERATPPSLVVSPSILEHKSERELVQTQQSLQGAPPVINRAEERSTTTMQINATTATALPTHPLAAPTETPFIAPPSLPHTLSLQDAAKAQVSDEKVASAAQQPPQDNRVASATNTTAPAVTVPTAGYNGITYEIPAYAFLGGERSAPVTGRDRYYDRGSGRRDYSRDRDRDRDYADYRNSRGSRDRYYDYDRHYERGSSSSRHRDWSRERYRDRERDRDYHRERDRGRGRDYHRDRDRDREYLRNDRERDRDRSAREREYDWYRDEYYHKSTGGHENLPTGPASMIAAIPTGPSAESGAPTSTPGTGTVVGDGNVSGEVSASQASKPASKPAIDADFPHADRNEPTSTGSSILPQKQERSLDPDNDYRRHPVRPSSPFDHERSRYDREYSRLRDHDISRDYDRERERDRIRERDQDRDRERDRDYERDRDLRDRDYRERGRHRERERDREYYYHQYTQYHHHRHGYPSHHPERGRYDREDYSRGDDDHRLSHDKRDHSSRPYWDRDGVSPDREGRRSGGSRSSSIDSSARPVKSGADDGTQNNGTGLTDRAYDNQESLSRSRRNSSSVSVNRDQGGLGCGQDYGDALVVSASGLELTEPRVENDGSLIMQKGVTASVIDVKRSGQHDDDGEDSNDAELTTRQGPKKIKLSMESP